MIETTKILRRSTRRNYLIGIALLGLPSLGFITSYVLDKSIRESKMIHENFYELADTNQNGKLDFDEWRKVYQKLGLEENIPPSEERGLITYNQMKEIVGIH